MRTVPPRPYTTVLRAISLAAVTILVWSTRVKPCCTAQVRTAWRTATTSFSARSCSTSALDGCTIVLVPVVVGGVVADGGFEELHAAFDVEGGPHTGEGEAQLDQGDGDRRLHSHHHRLRVEDAAHARDVGEHAADERVHNVQRADVDEHAARLVVGDAGGQIFLQLHGEAVVHVHLDGHEQVPAHAQD